MFAIRSSLSHAIHDVDINQIVCTDAIQGSSTLQAISPAFNGLVQRSQKLLCMTPRKIISNSENVLAQINGHLVMWSIKK